MKRFSLGKIRNDQVKNSSECLRTFFGIILFTLSVNSCQEAGTNKLVQSGDSSIDLQQFENLSKSDSPDDLYLAGLGFTKWSNQVGILSVNESIKYKKRAVRCFEAASILGKQEAKDALSALDSGLKPQTQTKK